MNEQAFPNPHRTNETGMTLRDYFAAKAMQGMLAGQDRRLIAAKEFIGETAYEYADILMKARAL